MKDSMDSEHSASSEAELQIGHKKTKKDEGEGPWLVSYADMMTLLMGFFALIASFSKPNQENFEKLKRETAKQFGGQYHDPYESVSQRLKQVIQQTGIGDQVNIEAKVDGVEITLNGTLLFESGEFAVKESTVPLIEKIGDTIIKDKQQLSVLVEGHTDSRPISQGIIASNWELSGLRAARVAQVIEKLGFAKTRMTIIGWGEAKPLVPNAGADGTPDTMAQAKNRRVVIKAYLP